jgi:hypothetical protein
MRCAVVSQGSSSARLVADHVSVLVVEPREAIEVDREQRRRELGGGSVQEARAIQHTGHRIDAGAPRHPAQSMLDQRLRIVDEADLVAVAQVREHPGELARADAVQHEGGDSAARDEHVLDGPEVLATENHDRGFCHAAFYSSVGPPVPATATCRAASWPRSPTSDYRSATSTTVTDHHPPVADRLRAGPSV